MDNPITQAHRANRLKVSIPFMDMRKNARVYGCLPVRMRGVDESGFLFKATSLIDNISSGGLYMQIGRRVAEGSRLFVLAQFVTGAIIAARGVIVRVEPLPHSLTGVAMRFTRTKLLPGAASNRFARQLE